MAAHLGLTGAGSATLRPMRAKAVRRQTPCVPLPLRVAPVIFLYLCDVGERWTFGRFVPLFRLPGSKLELDGSGNWSLPFYGTMGLLAVGTVAAFAMRPDRTFAAEAARERRLKLA